MGIFRDIRIRVVMPGTMILKEIRGMVSRLEKSEVPVRD